MSPALFLPVHSENTLIGYEYRTPTEILFFGNRAGSIEKIKSKYPELQFMHMKQIHGDTLVQAAEIVPTADAHWTKMLNTGLVVATADCLPILLAHAEWVCAIHAGWRGVKNEILISSLKNILKANPSNLNFIVAIGPHIHLSSFEVDLALAEEFQKQYKSYGQIAQGQVAAKHADATKAYVDLFKLARAQLSLATTQSPKLLTLSRNTFTDPEWASFRRDKNQAGRNLSFVARLRN